MSTTSTAWTPGPGHDYPAVPFYIGVTGHMDLETGDRPKVEQTLQALFDWLRGDQAQGEHFPLPGLNLRHTPLVVLSSLAPGADHWMAEFASQPDALSGGRPRAQVLSPLPFLPGQYERASTFQPTPSNLPPAAAPAERERHERHQKQREQAVAAALAFLQKQPSGDGFLVRLPDEVKLSDDQLRVRHEDPELLTGKGRKSERDRRYGAAGEYVAAYSDLLLVLADPLDRVQVERERREHPTPGLPDVGTHGIADVRRRGLTPGRLPIRPALSWADSGPVLRVTVFRRKTLVPDSQRNRAGAVEWLFPLDSCPRKLNPPVDADRHWQASGLEELRRFADNLDGFNRDRLPPGKTPRQNPDDEWHRMLRSKGTNAPALSTQSTVGEAPAIGELRGELHRIGRLRRWAATLNDQHDKGVRFLRGWLFLVALSAALSLALYEQWPSPPSPTAAAPGPETVTAWKWVFFWGSLVLTALAFRLTKRFRGEARDRMRTDYRAIAEGLRVQFFWTAAGTGQSVSSACLQRQRGELTWIRSAIASAAFPYERAAVAFAALPARTQHTLLNEVRTGWLEEQGGYFERRTREFRRLRHAWGELGQTLIWTALMLSVVGFLLAAVPALAGVIIRWRAVWLMAGFLGMAALAVWTYRTREEPQDGKPPEPRGGSKENGSPQNDAGKNAPPMPFPERLARWSGQGMEVCTAVLGRILPRLDGEHNARWRLGARMLAVTTLTLLLMGASYCLGDGILPPAAKLLGFCRTMSLSIGLLAGLWAATHFYADNIRRYGEMGELFRAAHRRLGEHLRLFGDVLDLDETLADPARRELAECARKDSQELLVDLGRETLYENSEWLSMHREHPIEPVSA